MTYTTSTVRLALALAIFAAPALAACDSGTATTAAPTDTASDGAPLGDASPDSAVQDAGAKDSAAADASAPADTSTAADTATGAETSTTPDSSSTADTAAPAGGWQVVDSGTKTSFGGIAWSGKQFVLTGSNSFFTSADGAKWSEQKTSEAMNWIGSIAWSGTTYAALAGWGGDTMVETSPDGIKWTDHLAMGTAQAGGITFGNGLFVASGSSGKPVTSPDGVKWTVQTGPSFNAVVYGGGKFVGVGGNCSIATSTDGVTWTSSQCLPSRTNKLTGVAWTGSQFVAVGDKGIAITSPDAVKWEDRTWDNAYNFKAVAGNSSIIVIVGAHGYPGVAASLMTLSADGKTWKKEEIAGIGSGLNAILWTGSQFWAVGNDGVIVSSK